MFSNSRDGSKLDQDAMMETENSRLKKQLHSLSFLHVKIKQKQRIKYAIQTHSRDHAKRIKATKRDHDFNIKANLSHVEERKKACISAVDEQVQNYLKVKTQYNEAKKELHLKERNLRMKLRELRERDERNVRDEVVFYRKNIVELRTEAHVFSKKYIKEHMEFVKDCMEKRKKENKSKRSIRASDEDSHDADVMSLVAFFRKDIRQLENIVDVLQGRTKSVAADENVDEEDVVDVLSLSSSGESSMSFEGENLILERTESK